MLNQFFIGFSRRKTMKKSIFILLAIQFVLTVQSAKFELSYKEWYDQYVRNCTAGSKLKYYIPNQVCTCRVPGVVDFCQYVGMNPSSGTILRAPALNSRARLGMGSRRSCYTLEGPGFYGCNWCFCDGFSPNPICTDLPCVKQQKKRLSKAEPKELVNFIGPGPDNCTKGHFMHEDGCNSCFCIKGWTFCTVMRCKPKKQLTKKTKNKHSCEDNPKGSYLHEDGCNTCICVGNNNAICTVMYCKNAPINPKKLTINDQSCKARPPGRFLADDGCNWCYCIGGKVMCTDIACLEPQVTLEKTMSDSICKDRRGYFQMDECNVCYCNNKGLALCTLHVCSYSKNGQGLFNIMKRGPNVCPTGKGEFKHEDGCNRCICIGVGEASCSANPCTGNGSVVQGQPKHKALLTAKSPTTPTSLMSPMLPMSQYRTMLYSLKDKAQKCKPGEKIKEPYGCNWCTCVDPGVVYCDTKACTI